MGLGPSSWMARDPGPDTLSSECRYFTDVASAVSGEESGLKCGAARGLALVWHIPRAVESRKMESSIV